MPDYRRPHVPGGTFFFTLVTEDRRPLFAGAGARTLLHAAIADGRRRRPFTLVAIVLLLDHLHALIELPTGDADFSSRWSMIKSYFTRHWLAAGGQEAPRTGSRIHNRRRGVWQRRFYEHVIRDQDDLNNHLNYIHYNPVKHGLATCPHAWPHSSFHRLVNSGMYERSWGCSCDGRIVRPPDFSWVGEGIEGGE